MYDSTRDCMLNYNPGIFLLHKRGLKRLSVLCYVPVSLNWLAEWYQLLNICWGLTKLNEGTQRHIQAYIRTLRNTNSQAQRCIHNHIHSHNWRKVDCVCPCCTSAVHSNELSLYSMQICCCCCCLSEARCVTSSSCMMSNHRDINFSICSSNQHVFLMKIVHSKFLTEKSAQCMFCFNVWQTVLEVYFICTDIWPNQTVFMNVNTLL